MLNPKAVTVESSAALLVQEALNTARSDDVGTLAPVFAPHALWEVLQFAVLFQLPPADPTQYLFAASACDGAIKNTDATTNNPPIDFNI